MNISIINGSPKPGESTSGLLIKYLLQEMGECSTQVFGCTLQTIELAKIEGSDVLVLVFPLYVDSIPSQLLRLLITLEESKSLNHDMMVYCIINNGFFEGDPKLYCYLPAKELVCRSKSEMGPGRWYRSR